MISSGNKNTYTFVTVVIGKIFVNGILLCENFKKFLKKVSKMKMKNKKDLFPLQLYRFTLMSVFL